MITVTTWTKALCSIRFCMMTMRVALVLGRIGQACHYGSLVIRDVTKKVCTHYEGLVTTNGYLRTVKTFQVNSGVGF